jgi:hypothetical protein
VKIVRCLDHNAHKGKEEMCTFMLINVQGKAFLWKWLRKRQYNIKIHGD